MKTPKHERVKEIFSRVNAAPPAHDRNSAHKLVKDILEDVENTFTTLPQNHPDRMRFFSLGIDIWQDEDKNPTHVKLNDYRAYIYDNGSIVIERISENRIILDKPGL